MESLYNCFGLLISNNTRMGHGSGSQPLYIYNYAHGIRVNNYGITYFNIIYAMTVFITCHVILMSVPRMFFMHPLQTTQNKQMWIHKEILFWVVQMWL